MELIKDLVEDPVISDYLKSFNEQHRAEALRKAMLLGILSVNSMQKHIKKEKTEKPKIKTKDITQIPKIAKKCQNALKNCSLTLKTITQNPTKLQFSHKKSKSYLPFYPKMHSKKKHQDNSTSQLNIYKTEVNKLKKTEKQVLRKEQSTKTIKNVKIIGKKSPKKIKITKSDEQKTERIKEYEKTKAKETNNDESLVYSSESLINDPVNGNCQYFTFSSESPSIK
ncbi:hypothetical protein SteCoe_8956 [Stentor coeruleus]|uniref:Uncharacterized protein n=1 Tax=Stentor coeruleus TaxID=5963 RepID=A0A1R2CJ17_9CILI|nr:hypothetical protein SteCoe_8956 [Stentor coeruleus]